MAMPADDMGKRQKPFEIAQRGVMIAFHASQCRYAR